MFSGQPSVRGDFMVKNGAPIRCPHP